MTLLREAGIRLLRNERVEVSREDATVVVAGVDDVFTKRIDIEEATAGVDGAGAVLMLAHDPRSFPELAQRGCSLVLSGHTHWGQVAVPWLASSLNYSRLVTKYASGRHHLDGCELYVNPGLGTTGPPVRLGTWPEITIIRLRCRS
jgi:predicted MPP superfamily phosphohydrolase